MRTRSFKYTYDRRGRGESTNSKPFAIDREVEDIEALINAIGGSAYVYGISSGACLALEAAIKLGEKVKKLAVYEPYYNSDPSALQAWKEYYNQLLAFIKVAKRGEAVELFKRYVGTPAEMIMGMRQSPVWLMLEAVAPSLVYDSAEIGENLAVPVSRMARIKARTLVIDGGADLQDRPNFHATATTLA